MIFDESSESPRLALFCARMLRDQEAGADVNDIGLAIAAESKLAVQSWNHPSGAVRPRMTYHANSQFGIWLISGTDDMTQVAALVSAYSLRIPNDTFPGLPNYFHDQGFGIGQLQHAVGRPDPQRVYYVGHSLGGALAQATCAMEERSIPRVNHLSVTFGSPRVGDDRFRQRLTRNSNTRWMNDDDSVPLLPPELPASIQFASGLGNEVLGRWASFVHGGGGVVCDFDGRPRSDVIPPFGVITGGASLVAWAFKAMIDSSTSHSMTEYVRRLQLLVGLVTPPVQARVVPSQPERNHTSDRASTNRQVQVWRSTIINTGVEQNKGPLVVPDDRAFQTLKVDGFWYTTFGGALVAIGPTRKRASLLATRGNYFLHRLQRMGGVDINALKFLFPIYLDAASSADGGFKPRIAPIASS